MMIDSIVGMLLLQVSGISLSHITLPFAIFYLPQHLSQNKIHSQETGKGWLHFAYQGTNSNGNASFVGANRGGHQKKPDGRIILDVNGNVLVAYPDSLGTWTEAAHMSYTGSQIKSSSVGGDAAKISYMERRDGFVAIVTDNNDKTVATVAMQASILGQLKASKVFFSGCGGVTNDGILKQLAAQGTVQSLLNHVDPEGILTASVAESVHGYSDTTITIDAEDKSNKIWLSKPQVDNTIDFRFGSMYGNSQAFAVAIAHMAVPRLYRTKLYRYTIILLSLFVFVGVVLLFIQKML